MQAEMVKGGEPAMPPLDSIGADLRITTPGQRRLALLRPLLGMAAYALAVHFRLWWVAPVIVFFIFVAVVTVTHDVVHGSLGLSRRQTDFALFFMGAILLESGHAYRASHWQHHRVFPGPDDPEGDPARMPLVKVILWGPAFLPRLWWWAYRRNARASERRWLLDEAALALAVVIVSILFRRSLPAMLVYVMLVTIGVGFIRC